MCVVDVAVNAVKIARSAVWVIDDVVNAVKIARSTVCVWWLC